MKVIKRWKTVLALKIPVYAPRGRRGEPAFNSADLSDRLHDITSELSIVDAAVHGLRVDDPEAYGLYLILRRQIDRIKAIKAEIHPPRVKRGQGVKSLPSSAPADAFPDV